MSDLALAQGAAVLAALGSGASVLVLTAGPGLPLDRLPSRSRGPFEPAPSARRQATVPFLAAALAAALVVAGLSATQLLLALVLAGAALGTWRAVVRGRTAKAAEVRRQQVVEACEAMVGELRAGQPPSRCLERAARIWPELEGAVRAARLGADVPDAMRSVASRPGGEGVTRIAAAWEICASTGTGLAFAVAQVLETARAEQATGRMVQGELASARATARLVAALPVVVLAASQGLGARPWDFLLATVPGLVCLATGVALAFAGLAWIDRIAARSVAGEP